MLRTTMLTISFTKGVMLSFGFALLIWLTALVSFSIGPIPTTLQTSAIMLAALLLPVPYSVGAVVIYLFMGIIGLPVFAGGKSGFAVILGPTGGFLIGFILAAGIISHLTQKIRFDKTRKSSIKTYGYAAFICFLGAISIHILGILWGKFITNVSWAEIMDYWVVPFYWNFIFKIILATVIGVQIWNSKYFNKSI
jgi:biotin transport system substrate-specific component